MVSSMARVGEGVGEQGEGGRWGGDGGRGGLTVLHGALMYGTVQGAGPRTALPRVGTHQRQRRQTVHVNAAAAAIGVQIAARASIGQMVAAAGGRAAVAAHHVDHAAVGCAH